MALIYSSSLTTGVATAARGKRATTGCMTRPAATLRGNDKRRVSRRFGRACAGGVRGGDEQAAATTWRSTTPGEDDAAVLRPSMNIQRGASPGGLLRQSAPHSSLPLCSTPVRAGYPPAGDFPTIASNDRAFNDHRGSVRRCGRTAAAAAASCDTHAGGAA